MFDIVIQSERVLTAEACQRAAVCVKNGKIVAIEKTLPSGDFPVEDVGNHVLMAGVVDPHVHINEPGRTDWEGFDTATKAAVAGGITSLIEMPLNASPVTTTTAAFDKKIAATKGQLHTNCGFWGGIIPGNTNEIEPLIEKGVPGFKAFLTDSGIDEFPNVEEDDLRKAMPILARHNVPLLVHSEWATAVPGIPVSSRRYIDYLHARPRSWEDNAIALLIKLCEAYNCKTHIVHLSSADSIAQIQTAKEKGLPLTAETAQHYLYFTAEEIEDGKTEYKCAPPIREKENNERLWQALTKGIIDFVATDHSPSLPAMKETTSGDFMKAWGGISSLQWALPILWTVAQKKNAGLTNIAAWLCEKPALLPQLESKGKIAVGYDADFVVWNPEEKFIITKEKILHKHSLTPYLGKELSGVIKQTWINGEKLFENEKFLHLNKGKILRW